MFLNRHPRHRQRGLGLIAAIFVITIMAVITVGLSSLVVTSKASYGYEILSARALLLAESGAQMASSHLRLPAEDGDCDSLPQQLPPAELRACTLVVSCPRVTLNGTDYFTVSSTATCGSGIDQAIRYRTMRLQR